MKMSMSCPNIKLLNEERLIPLEFNGEDICIRKSNFFQGASQEDNERTNPKIIFRN